MTALRKRCLSCNAAAVIFAHIHPSGVAERGLL
ncbi:MAG: JAB domain-containing protein [Granulosicoccus sp.]